VTVVQAPRYIDTDLCIACGTCAEKCPKRVVDAYNAGLSKRKAAYLPYPQAVPQKYVIDSRNCIYFLKPGAVKFDQEAEVHKIRVGAVIMSPGFVPYDPLKRDTFSYGRHPNVVTSLEFERVLSSCGPYLGHMVRPSDHKEPKKIAWLQCVGSRDSHQNANPYCSTVCCTYSIKEAMVAKEHSSGPLDTAIFYIDIRTHGKDFEKYYMRAMNQGGVRFIKSKIDTVVPVDDTGDLRIRYTDGAGKRVEEDFDMVVLSVGMSVRKNTVSLAEKLGIQVNQYRFAATSSFAPVETSRSGIYVCGAFHDPKDIPYSVMQASAAACAAGGGLSEARGTMVQERPQVAERVIVGEPPRLGVFVCNCGKNIGAFVRVPEVAEYAKSLPYVSYVEENLFTCSQDTQEKIQEVIKEHGLFEMANIRNQCSWVHSTDPDAATEKSKDLVRMAVAKAARLEPLEEVKLDVTQAGLVIGGGLAGVSAALGLADQGFPVHLVEKEETLGGHGQNLLKTWKGEDIGGFLAEAVQRVEAHPLISVHLQSTVAEAEGFVGNFRTTVKTGEETRAIEHGATIIATGGHQLEPSEYHFGEHPNILTSLDLNRTIRTDPERLKEIKSAAFIQCVGSREPERPYCSKVCCTQSIKNAVSLKELHPDMDIYILFRDIRTYGQREEIYREARSKGIAFIRFSVDQKPKVEITDNKLTVTVVDQMLQMEVRIDADLITLASAIVPPEGNRLLSRLYKLALNEEGFFQEAHAKLRPVDFATDGVYMAGLAHGPKPVEESIAQAQAAAARATALLAAKTVYTSAVVAYTYPQHCSARDAGCVWRPAAPGP